MKIFSRIIGTGSYLPEKCVTNHDLAKIVDTNDEWIVSRTGIRERHFAAEDQNSSDLALIAAQRAMQAAGVQAGEIDLIIVATSTPDMVFPSTACILQDKLGVKQGAAFDVQAVCAGFVYALSLADKQIQSGASKCALVVGAEIMSRILDFTDRSTCVLFGDGAGAVILKPSETAGILSTHLHADGSCRHILCAPGTVANGVVKGAPVIYMEGGAVYKVAVQAFEAVSREALQANALSVNDVDWLIYHQANVRIITHVAHKLGVPDEKVVLTLDRHGNTSAASIPLALDVTAREGKLKAGQAVLLAALGGGLTWGAVMLRW